MVNSKEMNKKRKGDIVTQGSNLKKFIKQNCYDSCQIFLDSITESSRELLLNIKIEYDNDKYYPIVIAAFEGRLSIIRLLDYYNPKKDILNNFVFQNMNLLHSSIYTNNYEMFCYLLYRKNVPLIKPISCLVSFKKMPDKKNTTKLKIIKDILDYIVDCKPGAYNKNFVIDSIDYSFLQIGINKDLSAIVCLYYLETDNIFIKKEIQELLKIIEYN